MWKNRLAFALLYAALLVLLILFSKPFLLAALIVLAVSAALMALLTRRDARLLRTSVRVKSGGREGETVPMTFTFAPKRRLLAAQSILVEVESRNDMFGVSVHKHLLFDLADDQQEYTIGVPLVWCGKVTFRCISVQVRDMFGLFSSRAKPFTEICTVAYPHHVRVSTELSSATVGATRNDGVMQNRKGSDASEMFDIRDYVPGDDIRTIHWKLSGKTDEMIVRQASDPSHYNIALLPDFGRSHLAGPEAQQELNAAVAIASAIAGQLIRRGVPFCTVVPTKQGVERFEVCTERDFHELLPRWLSFPVQETGGSGLRYFVMEHLDRYFTRLLIFSAGHYEQELSGLDSRIGVLVLSAVSGIKTARVEGSGSCGIMELPAEQDINEVYRVVC